MRARGGRIAWIVILALTLPGCGGPPIDLILVGGLIVDPASEGPPRRLDIAIDDGLILEIGENLQSRYSARVNLMVEDHTVIPGLVDMHSHFANGILPPGEDDTTQVLARHLYFGNTTILNLGSAQAWPERIDALRAAMEAGDLLGPRLLAVGSLITRVGSHPTTTIYAPPLQEEIAAIVAAAPADGPIDLAPLRATTLVRTPEDVTREVHRVAEWGADAIKITVESGPPEFGVHPRMTPEMITAAVEAARPFGVPVLCHVSMLPELEDCISHGADGAVHGLTPEEPLPADLEQRMVDADFVLIPTAGMFDAWTRLSPETGWSHDFYLNEILTEREQEWLGSSEMLEEMAWTDETPVARLGEHIVRFHDLGGRVVAGTDAGNPYRFAGHSLHEELEFYVRHGMSPKEALATATIEAARLVGAEHEWGSIREGLAADLVVLRGNPLEAIELTRSIAYVIRAGQIVERHELPVR